MYPSDVLNKRVLEHGVQAYLVILHDVLKATLLAVLCDDELVVWVEAHSNEPSNGNDIVNGNVW